MCALLFLFYPVSAQSTLADSSSIIRKRLLFVSAANAAFFTGSFIALDRAWYNDFEKTKFHFFNDNPEWNQIDKAGHIWSTYHISRASSELWKWTGMNQTQSAIAGAASGMVYQSIIEFQDAYSAAWGFSWGDVAANVAGAGMFLAQDVGWNEQRLQIKLGYHPYDYPTELKDRRNELFGKSTAERILKDYNAQTYWITANLSSFFPETNMPKWLNVAAGYAAEGMYGGRSNYWTDEEGQTYDYREVKRLRNFYLGPDVDLTRIPVKSKLVRSLFFVLSAVKIPAPALELRNGKIKGVIR